MHSPPAHDPNDKPSMKTDITIDKTGAIIPNEVKANRNQIIW
jgi:hypothetical protein